MVDLSLMVGQNLMVAGPKLQKYRIFGHFRWVKRKLLQRCSNFVK